MPEDEIDDPRNQHVAWLHGRCHPAALTRGCVNESGQIILECGECQKIVCVFELKNPPPVTCHEPQCGGTHVH